MSLILGIDPGSRITGYGIVESAEAGIEYITSGCIRTAHHSSLPDKLDEIFRGVSEIIERHGPQEMAIEEVFMSRSAGSALKLGQARGAAIIAATRQSLPVHEYAARTVKQAVVGKGAATKEQVQHMVRVLLRLDGTPQEDAADALAIAICHINTSQTLLRISGADTYGHGRLRPGRLGSKV
jgi:crossover junction endodeoxyribonuclease RuvC